jgi:flagellar basal-body rod protein FlgB
MRLDGLPVFAALKDALDYNAARSRVLAANIANSDTPDFTPQDIAQGDFQAALAASRGGPNGAASGAKMTLTDPRHMTPSASTAREWHVEDAPDSETTLDGNAVVLEEQMAKVAETRMRYEAAIGLYEKTLNIIRIAAKSPSR